MLNNSDHGIDAFHVKIIALIAMTLDHISAYIDIYPRLRMIGRVAAILFLYILIDGFYNTKRKPLFIARLFVANFLMVLTTATMNLIIICSHSKFPNLGYSNIFGTWFTTLIIIFLLELIISSCVKVKKNYRRSFGYFVCLVLTIIIPVLYSDFIRNCKKLVELLERLNLDGTMLAVNVFTCLNSLLPNIRGIEYSMLFVCLGCFLYFFRERNTQVIIILIASMISLIGSLYHDPNRFGMCSDFFAQDQWIMVFSIIIIRRYNGKIGVHSPKFKIFFYIYYPIHIYILFILGWLIRYG